MTERLRPCGLLVVYEGGEAATICRQPYGHDGLCGTEHRTDGKADKDE